MAIVLNDDDLAGYTLMKVAIESVEGFLLARALGKAVSPPRHHVAFGDHGNLVFTVGGLTGDRPLAGFRVYDTFNGDAHAQLVASVIGVIGSGAQARMQLAAAACVRTISKAYVYSRDAKNRAAFAEGMQIELGVDVEPVARVKDAVRDADIVICATSSSQPVVDISDLKPGAHVNTVGPKTIEAHELGLSVADAASIIATDSSEQTRSYGAPFFLEGSGQEQRMVELSDIVAGRIASRTSSEQTTLFCSVGLAGTEVAVAAAIFDMLYAKERTRCMARLKSDSRCKRGTLFTATTSCNFQ
ncbi:ornithine cyclodeaminase/alanine dehydrogenase-like protein (mu-crystallin family) [Agrobacterium larrymoorei]|uniref:Ornithine cyclodeaminase/alanine dehydrogenase-like protein (Mu-crystallin family) n=1 Tax=Agrobacterium larrymoorei TaxID=160699 RepID=A0AAJ2BK43_9HYPH|nr:ornithine cyclodeaminase family protein [Agrobacterium larrymoorei]MDR6104149.1 ornithine cyclodeaminase/alanine dehydrogenase-like protein (mu-crystallin family) [Agrobacterium larrymoorei]